MRLSMIMRNYLGRGFCYLPKPKVEADNTDRGLKGAVSSYTHMLLRITNLKALGQRFQV